MPAFNDMEFLTTAEVADKLKMHPQVILRKLKTGEIPGYKIGKEWRVAGHELLEWLQRHANGPRVSRRERVERAFFKDGRLAQIPAQRKKRIYVLERLLREFEPNRVYAEAEVNSILRKYHDDVCTLRREFICENMMYRSENRYNRATSYRHLPDD